MSSTKYLVDLLKVCSVLPALAIMPVMASNDPNLSDNAFVLGDVVTNETIWGGVRIESDDPMVLAWPEYKMVARSFDLTGIKDGKQVYFGPIDLTVRELADDEEFAWNSQRYDESGNPIDFDFAKYNTDGSERDKQVVWNNANGVEELGAMDRFLTRDDSKEAGKVTVTSSDVIMAGSKITAKEIVFNDSSLNIIKDLPELAITSDGVAEIVADELDVKGNSQIVVAPGTQLDIQVADVKIESVDGGLWAENNAKININANKAGEIEISSIDGEAVKAYNNGQVNIGSADTESVKISSDTNNAVYTAYNGDLPNKEKSITNITGKEIEISTGATGWGAIHVASNVPDIDYANSATVNITGDSIKILAPTDIDSNGIGIAAMSRGIINVVGDTTISAEKAIAARGEAKVNINTSGEHTVKMLGDIVFDYDKETSGTAVDAFVDVTLAGKESFWTGNMKASYGSGKPADASYLEVNSAKLTMKDGAVWNATEIVDFENEDKTSGVMYAALNDLIINNGTVNIEDTERGITVDRIVANDAVFNGSILNVNESIKIESGLTTFKSDVMGRAANAEEGIEAATLTLDSGATMDIGTSTLQFDTMNIDGTVIASVTNGSPYGRLYGEIVAGDDALLQLNVGSVGIYKIFNTVTDMAINAGATYDVINNGVDGIVVATKSIAAIADDAGISTPAAGIVAGLANSQDATLQKVSLAMQEVLNSGDIATVERETKKLNPTDNPVTQAVASSVQSTVSSLVSNRMSMPAMGRNGGDVNLTSGAVWAQGLYNKTKMNDQFNGYTRGIAAGIDGTLDNDITVGAGYAFNHSDIALSSRNTDIDSHTVFLYGQYKPSEWFVNTTLNYTLSDYAENVDALGVAVVSDYKTDAFGAQLMTGYDFDSGITPEFGLRYLHVNGVTYQNSLGIESALNSADYLTAMLGTKYGFDVVASDEVLFRPELRYAVKYDMVSDETSATVAMPGVAAYTVNGDRLSRVGAEFGIGLTMKYKEFDMSLSYDIDVREGYTSQTGMLKLRAEF